MAKKKKQKNKYRHLSFGALFLRKMKPCLVVVVIIFIISGIVLSDASYLLAYETGFNNIQIISKYIMAHYYQVQYDENGTCNGKSRQEVENELFRLYEIYMNTSDFYNISVYTGLYDKDTRKPVSECREGFYMVKNADKGLVNVSVFEAGESKEFQRLLSNYNEENGGIFVVIGKFKAVEIRACDIYERGSEFIPGKVTLYGIKRYYYDNVTGIPNLSLSDYEIIGEYDFTPQDTAGYTHIIYCTENSSNIANNINTQTNSVADVNVDTSKYGKVIILCELNVNEQVQNEKEQLLKNSENIWNDASLYDSDKVKMLYSISDTVVLGDREYVLLRIMQFDKITYFWFPLFVVTLAVLILGTGIVLIVTYMACRKEKERQKFNQYRRTITGSMAHDLKSPLMVVSGYAENLMENVNNDKKNHYAREILDNVEYMNELIENILELSSFEEENIRLQLQEVDLEEIIMHQFKMYQGLIKEKNLKVNLELQREIKTEADKKLMLQLFDNLIGNAVKHNMRDGYINISILKNEVCIENTADMIDGKEIEKLCEPYVKGDKSRGGRSGSGLGLAIAKHIVDMHEYDMEICYNDGVFTVRVLT